MINKPFVYSDSFTSSGQAAMHHDSLLLPFTDMRVPSLSGAEEILPGDGPAMISGVYQQTVVIQRTDSDSAAGLMDSVSDSLASYGGGRKSRARWPIAAASKSRRSGCGG